MKTKWTRRLWIGAVFVGVMAMHADASAQTRRGRRVIRIAETKIEGRIQKPQAFYILQRSNLNFEGLELKNSFVPKIIKSVEQAPF
ncbi:hypothetical protein L6R52_39535 [Myxococcota bacterium]|nr:hypothetical protein [Myxococcota bacterium]